MPSQKAVDFDAGARVGYLYVRAFQFSRRDRVSILCGIGHCGVVRTEPVQHHIDVAAHLFDDGLQALIELQPLLSLRLS